MFIIIKIDVFPTAGISIGKCADSGSKITNSDVQEKHRESWKVRVNLIKAEEVVYLSNVGIMLNISCHVNNLQEAKHLKKC